LSSVRLRSLMYLTLLDDSSHSTDMQHAASQKIFLNTKMLRLIWRMGMGENRELLDGKMGVGFKFQVGMGTKSLKW